MEILNFDRIKGAFPKDSLLKVPNFIQNAINYGDEVIKYPEKVLQNFLGIKELKIRRNDVLFDITGKINAKKNDLGYINTKNIEETFVKFNTYGLMDIDISKALKQSEIFIVDITKDLHLLDITPEEMIKSIKLSVLTSTDKLKVLSYEHQGLMILPRGKTIKGSICFYNKGIELCSSKSSSRYTSIIGEDFVQNANNILRCERHIYDKATMRKAFNLPKSDSKIYLQKIINSQSNPIYETIQNFTQGKELF
ncbi:MAG: hypothetical protein PHX18_05285 [Candidatus Gastranaerophilales bacterium]|nr:hypothetical protein [Candidatus Gastranaerophilales bacterium]